MRWNCPHCGVSLALGDERLGSGWSFSRCYKCGGFALLRKSDINLIKMDRAPVGEQVLLPEANEEPMLGAAATQKLQRALGRSATSALSSQAAARGPARPAHAATHHSTSSPAPAAGQLGVVPPRPGALTAAAARAAAPELFVLPEPLPEIPDSLLAAGALRATVPSAGRLGRSFSGALAGGKALPTAIAVAGVLAVASGGYLFLQSHELYSQAARASARAARTAAEASLPDLPLRSTSAAPAPAVATAPQTAVVARIPADAVAATVETVDTPPIPSPDSQILVRPSTPNAKLRSGPGLTFPVVGIANPDALYVVQGWNDRWFKVVERDSSESLGPVVGWIRNDLIRVTSR